MLLMLVVCEPIRNVVSRIEFCICYRYGSAHYTSAIGQGGVRTHFYPIRNVGSRTYFCFCSNGGAYSYHATNRGGVRPSFLNTLEMLLDLFNSVFAMVMHFMIMLPVFMVYEPVRNVASTTQLCRCTSYGDATYGGASYRGGVRTIRNVGRSGYFCECSTYGLAVSDIATHRNGVRPNNTLR